MDKPFEYEDDGSERAGYEEDGYYRERIRYARLLKKEGLPLTAAKVKSSCFSEILQTLVQEAGRNRATQLVVKTGDAKLIIYTLEYVKSLTRANRKVLIAKLIKIASPSQLFEAFKYCCLNRTNRNTLAVALARSRDASYIYRILGDGRLTKINRDILVDALAGTIVAVRDAAHAYYTLANILNLSKANRNVLVAALAHTADVVYIQLALLNVKLTAGQRLRITTASVLCLETGYDAGGNDAGAA